MKAVFYIFTVYLMATLMAPCSDFYDEEAFHHKSYSIQTSSQSNHHHDHSEMSDHCSPFCLCGCSGMITIIANHTVHMLLEDIKPVEDAQPTLFYTTSFVSRYFGDIWQPPKINV